MYRLNLEFYADKMTFCDYFSTFRKLKGLYGLFGELKL